MHGLYANNMSNTILGPSIIILGHKAKTAFLDISRKLILGKQKLPHTPMLWEPTGSNQPPRPTSSPCSCAPPHCLLASCHSAPRPAQMPRAQYPERLFVIAASPQPVVISVGVAADAEIAAHAAAAAIKTANRFFILANTGSTPQNYLVTCHLIPPREYGDSGSRRTPCF